MKAGAKPEVSTGAGATRLELCPRDGKPAPKGHRG